MQRLRIFLRHRYLLTTTILAVVCAGSLWAVVGWNVRVQSDLVPLHYNIYFGIDLFGPWWYAYGAPAVGTIVLIVNAVLAVLLCSRDTLAASSLVTAALAVEVFLLLTTLLTIANV